MKLYYAIGGGMGHLSRAAAFFYSQNIDLSQLILLTASPHVGRILPTVCTIILAPDLASQPEKLAAYMTDILRENAINRIYLDCFPLGIVGEWAHIDTQNIEIIHLARLLRWQEYRRILSPQWVDFSPPRFDKVYILEPLEAEHEAFLRANSAQILPLQLKYPPAVGFDLRAYFATMLPIWLIVHSENAAELAQLYAYAQDVAQHEKRHCCFVLLTSVQLPEPLGAHTFLLDYFPAYPFFGQAERIFTAAGFNLMQELAEFRDRHHILPFPRRFDNQFLRAQRWRNGS
jgi:hypothetical protein